jgi:chemotaxis protein methyltransferase WspC
MTMALLSAGFPSSLLYIDAVDVSVRLLQRAHRAVYGKNSFRGKALAFRDCYFEALGSRYRLAEAVRAPVRFHHGNVLDPGFLPDAAAYDCIFCRNVLIYFDRDTQERTLQVLARLLKPDGLLFVGPSEGGLLLARNFVSAKVPLAFAFRKETPLSVKAQAEAMPSPQRRRAMATRSAVPPVKPRPQPVAMFRSVKETPQPITAQADLDEIEILANQGHIVHAIQRCEQFLKIHGPSARAYHLLALAHDANGRHGEAEQYYRKTLYLDPAHPEALLHLAYLLEERGDAMGANRLRNRAKRVNSANTA